MIKTNPLHYKDLAINATLTGYHAAFWVALGFCALAVLTAFMMKNRGQASDYPSDGGDAK